MSITVENLEFSYGKKKILKDISFSAQNGELIGILGPNGSGKSTLLKNIIGYYKPNSGKVILKNNLTTKDIAFIPQRATVGINLKVRDLVLMGRFPHLKSKWVGYTEHDQNIVNNTLENLELTEFTDRSILTLSGGEFQKILLAKALVQEPKILIFDEPTSDLDMNHAVELMATISELITEENITGLIVMHDVNLASQFCSRVIFMKDGKIEADGKPISIFHKETFKKIYNIEVDLGWCSQGHPYVIPRAELKGKTYALRKKIQITS